MTDLQQQTADYAVQQIGTLSARLAAKDLELLDVRGQLVAALGRIAVLEIPAEVPKVRKRKPKA